MPSPILPVNGRAAVVLAASLAVLTGSAAAGARQEPDLKRLTIEELMEIDVTLATRQAEPVGTTAAAVSVITADDIRRAGVTTIADALRLAGGVHVARLNNASWAITARGFNGNTPNKLLVMIDGRTEYSPLFAGVFWNTLDYVLEDVERIEVIRGPGATLWGANAVNGVVNIITRHTRDTRGTYVAVGAGNEDPALVEVRQGGAWGGSTWRVYGKYAQRDNQQFSTGISAEDGRRRGQAGFRMDAGDSDNSWLVKADAFHGRDDFIDRRDGEWTSLALQTRWHRVLSPRSRLDLQSYYRREYRNIERQLTHHIDTVDIDLQHAVRAGARHHVVWGAGYRRNTDRTHGSTPISFDPIERAYPVFNLFAQDEIAVIPDRLDITAGMKLEHNAFSGGEWQPNVRARLRLPRRQVLWGALARAVRRPTRFDDDLILGGPGGTILVRGSDDFEAESLVAGEVGYRIQPVSRFSADLAVFRHRYDDLRSQETPLGGVIPVVLGNTLEGQSHGVELAVNLQAAAWWRAHASYTWLDTSVERAPGSRDVGGGVSEANDPHHLLMLRTSLDVRDDLEVDAMLRGVGALPEPRVPAFAELTLRLGWQIDPRIEIAVIGDDLLHDQHPEFGSALPRRIEFERSVRALLTLRFR